MVDGASDEDVPQSPTRVEIGFDVRPDHTAYIPVRWKVPGVSMTLSPHDFG